MVRLILLLLLVVLMAGGGVGTWWFGIRGEPVPEMAGLNPMAQDGDGTSGERAQLAHLPSEYSETSPLSIPVMEEGRVTQLLTLVLELEVAGSPGLEAVANNRPELRDKFLTELHALYSLDFVREKDDQLNFVKQRLLKAGQEVVGSKLRAIELKAIQERDVDQNS